MTIIKRETVNQTALLTPAGELLNDSREDYRDLIEEECRKAFQKGVSKGEEIGYKKALEENRTLLTLLQKMSRKVLEQKGRLLDQLKPEIVEFTIAICERVIRQELSQPKSLVQLITSLLNAALPALKDDQLHIVLSPDDYALLEHSKEQILKDKRKIEGIHFVSDPLMRRGDCRIEAKSGLLNYDIGRELKDLQSKVLQHD